MKSNIFSLQIYFSVKSLNAPRLFENVFFNGKPSHHQVNNYIEAWVEISGTEYDSLVKGEPVHIPIDNQYNWFVKLEEIQVIIGLDKFDLFSYCIVAENTSCLCISGECQRNKL